MTTVITPGRRGLACALTLLLAGCGHGTGSAPGTTPAATFTDIVREQGGYVYPAFQRWRIVASRVVPPASVPADLGGIPAILRGRFVYFDEGYLTFPSLNSDGDAIVPACFVLKQQQLSATPVSARDAAGALALDFQLVAPGRMTTIAAGMFELTLQREPPAQDEGYQRRLFISHFNQHPEVRSADRGGVACKIHPLPAAPLAAGDFRYVAFPSGREFIERGGEMDPLTPIRMSGGSAEWRSQIDPPQAVNRVAGCAGSERVIRLLSGDSPDSTRETVHALITTIGGVMADGEACERIVRLRRIDPAAIFDLFDIPGSPAPMAGRPGLDVHLDEWLSENAFRAQIGRLHFEFSDLDAARIRVTLIDNIALPPSHPVPTEIVPAPAVIPPHAGDLPTSTPPVDGARSGPGKIHRWVDANGVVNYSDRQEH
ncbi:MAG: hypothetical protein U1F35_00785 [Steroidobacteraceae bacterium]